MNSKILMSVMVVGVALMMGAVGGLAYFSDTERSNNNMFSAGSLDMAVWDHDASVWRNDNPASATWESPSSWAPGDTLSARFKLKNVGTIDITYLLFRDLNYTHNGQGDGSDLGNVIWITEIEEFLDGTSKGSVDGATYESWIPDPPANQDGHLTLNEFRAGIPPGTPGATDDWDVITGMDRWGGDEAIPVGSVYAMELSFKFDPNAGNVYQNDTCSFDWQAYGTHAPNEENLPSYVPE